jgi:membrane fusion protein, multidrug efflux system
LAGTFGTRQKVEQADAQEKRFAATLARNLADLDGQRQQLAVLDTQELQVRADYKAKTPIWERRPQEGAPISLT